MAFLKKYTEILLIGFCLLSVYLKQLGSTAGFPLFIIANMLLGMFYILSGQLVLSDKTYPQSVRLAYTMGFWGIAIGLIGWLFKALFWPSSTTILLTGFSSCIIVMFFILIVIRNKDIDDKKVFSNYFRPLTKRLAVYGLVLFALYIIPSKVVFENLAHPKLRNEEAYMEMLFRSLEDGKNYELKDSVRALEDQLRYGQQFDN